MNVVLIICDTVRADYLGCYGNPWVRTPHLDALAARSALFERFYPASFPTGPMRKDVHSGRFTFAYSYWQTPPPEGEPLVAELLSAAGVRTAYIGDTNNSRQYLRGFEHTELVDCRPARLSEVPDEVPLGCDPRKMRRPDKNGMHHAREWAAYDGEIERRAPRTALAAHRWLEDRTGDDRPFFLWVDTFDPHEPWDAPQHYVDLYDPGYQGDRIWYPAYEPADYATADEIRHMRCLYAAKLTMVDRWVGFLLEGLSRMPFADETAIVFTSDHGFYHGEHNLIGKVLLDHDDDTITGRWPLYEPIAHAPLLVSVPGLVDGGERRRTFVQAPDLMPTVLELFGVAVPDRVQGRSILPVLRDETDTLRDAALSTCTYAQDAEVRSPSALRTDKWMYVYGGDEWPSELYDLRDDPAQERNVFDRQPQAAREMHERYVAFLEEIGCPPDVLAGRRAFNPTPRSDLPRHRLI